jgi:hypothetical protein
MVIKFPLGAGTIIQGAGSTNLNCDKKPGMRVAVTGFFAFGMGDL